MRRLSQLSYSLLAIFVVLFSTGCDPDSGGTNDVVLEPALRLNTGSGIISGDQDLDLATPSFIVNITGNEGTAQLNSLRIEENGLAIPADRLIFRTGQTSNNPILLLGDDKTEFTYEIEILGNNGTVGSSAYTFILRDDGGLTDAETINVNFTRAAPLVELLVEDGFVSGNTTLATFNGAFSVRVLTTKTEADLETLSVLEDGVLLPASQLTFNDGSETATNPWPFATGEMSGTPRYRIRVDPENTINGDNDVRTFTFRAKDVNGVTGETSIDVNFEPPVVTALTFDTTGVFFNAIGSQRGALDLDNAKAVRFNSVEAELQDEGIDPTIPTGTENWRAQISGGASGSVVRLANLVAYGDGVNFASVSSPEEIRDIFEDDSSTELDGNDAFPGPVRTSDPEVDEKVSQPLLGADANRAGEVFVVKRDNNYYIVQFTKVNYVPNSNDDNYNVAIKY
ncbi:hypothetical protein [Neolewinella antarctica]|uniref:Uncharacterized protein n=1 Tax=Neolewinella antarctica TaxID=442734 RepID=A0ABX0XAK6_9BACT|nr:hypothetical protein [Neolewinella antarctica]NJC26090.1 hypothetical protein [Neolewinella antarctica]